MLLRRALKNKLGAALVEYALLIGGVALISAGAVSLFGHKTSDIIATVTAILPGAHTDDNAPVMSGHLIETGPVGPSGSEAIDVATIAGETGVDRLGENLVGDTTGSVNGVDGLVIESK